MRRCLVALAPILLATLGCSDSGPPLASVRGRVTLDSQPLAFKSVRFIPEPGTPGTGAGANTTADGTYTLLAIRPGATRDMQGVPPGSYRVVVTEPLFPIEAPPAQGPDGTPAPAIGLPEARVRKRPVIPPQYSNPDTTDLRVTVPAEGGVRDLTLRSQP